MILYLIVHRGKKLQCNGVGVLKKANEIFGRQECLCDEAGDRSPYPGFCIHGQ